MQLSPELAQQLDQMASATGVTPDVLATSAIRDFLAQENFQIGEIMQAIREADANDFASDAEIAATDAKWVDHAA
ncbi:hypothetical protein AGMMS49545_10960 [Betaproteobacteria bacterium]|nr:hypothetical protein AGMMS49545_10960 [Betaproteobacteria bacterium]